MGSDQRIGLDSDALTFLVEAMSGTYDPEQDQSAIALERVAMFRIFLHTDHPLFLTPTVERQYEAIRSESRPAHWDVHRFFICDALGNVPPVFDETKLEYFRTFHSGADDCRIAVEAEQAGLALVLSRDERFAKRLNPVLNGLRIERPTTYWDNLDIPRGARPRRVPVPESPLANVSWWIW